LVLEIGDEDGGAADVLIRNGYPFTVFRAGNPTTTISGCCFVIFWPSLSYQVYNMGMNDQPDTPQKLIVYGHDYCGQARTLVRALNQREIEYEWRDIQHGDPVWKEELRALAKGCLSVPTVIFPDGEVMVEPWPEASRICLNLGNNSPNFVVKSSIRADTLSQNGQEAH
jgi:glutaredoxin-related protein